MTETYITHPGMISVDGGITWYTPDELVAAKETDALVEALGMHENEWLIDIAITRDMRARICEEHPEIVSEIELVAEYARSTGREVRMRTRL